MPWATALVSLSKLTQIGPLEGPNTAETLEVPWDTMENARAEALHRTDSGDFGIGNPDVFIKEMLNTVRRMQQLRHRWPSESFCWADENKTLN